MVRDTGSWLEIGETISQFSIGSLMGLVSVGLVVGGEKLMGNVKMLEGDRDADQKERKEK
jgi:hypothetical protein